jgi:hypothetical protein
MKRQGRTVAAICSVVLVLAISACSVDDPPSPVIPTSPAPPSPSPPITGNYVVSGVISETTPNGPKPLAGATVEVSLCYRSNPNALETVQTDAAGAYRVSGVCSGTGYIWAYKPGYTTKVIQPCDGGCFQLVISADTRFDVELVPQ